MTTPVDLQGPAARPPQQGLARALAVATALVFLVGMVGLGTIKRTPARSHDVLAAVFDAASRTAAVTTARVSISTETGVSANTPHMPAITMDGAIQYAPARAINLTFHLGNVSVQALQVGNEAYIRVPDAVRSRVPTAWVSVDVPPQGGNPLTSLAGPALGGGGDPTAILGQLRANGVVKSATEGDRRSVRGTSTTVYHLVLDAAAYKEALNGEEGANPALAALVGAQVQLADPKLDLYIDDAGLVRRQVMNLSASYSGAAKGVTISVDATTDLYDFNKPVVVNPPPANQVTHVPSIADAQRYLSGSG